MREGWCRASSAIAAVREHSGLQSERALSDLADYLPIRVILLVIPRKLKPKPDNPEPFKRFIDMAREVEVDESPEALERAVRKVTGRLQKSESLARSDRNRSRRNRDEGCSQR